MSFSKTISEAQIEEQVEALENPLQVEAAMVDLQQQAPVYLAYAFSEDTKLLRPAEQDLLTFMIALLWKVAPLGDWKDAELDEEEISALEDKNWERFEKVKGDFRKRLDAFFESTDQEDLLAIIEDLLMDDEDETLSNEGRDHIFILSKTFLDILIA